MEIKDDRMCFACGKDNPISLGLEFVLDDKGRAVASFTPLDVHQGYNNIVHGGLVSTLLDEAMAKVIYLQGIKAVTAEMKTRFKKSLRIGEKVEVTGILLEKHHKLIFTEAYLKNESDEIIARAEAKFIVV